MLILRRLHIQTQVLESWLQPYWRHKLQLRVCPQWRQGSSVSILLCCCLVSKLYPTLATPWTVAWQSPLSMRFTSQEYWSGSPFLSPGDLPDPGIELASSALTNRFSALASNSFLYHLATRVDPTSFVHAQLLSHVWLFAIPWTVTHKTHLSMRPPLLVSDWLRSSMRTVALQAPARWFH